METFSIFDWKKSEVVTVVTVLLVILGISAYQLSIGQIKARDAQRKADVELIGRALERYYLDYEEYPSATAGGRMVACGERGAVACNWGSDDRIVDYDNVEYLKGLTTDPKAYEGRQYVYTTDGSKQNFRIYVALEYQQDKSIRTDLTEACGNGIQCNWYVQN